MATETEVLKVAKLAKLQLSQEEITNFVKQFSNIMQMIKPLQEVDCRDIEPLKSISNQNQRMRPDVVDDNAQRASLLSNAPGTTAELAKEVGCFIVPKVIE